VKIRFSTEYNSLGVADAGGKIHRIVTTNVFKDPNYILATLLDPRLKTSPFTGSNLYKTNAFFMYLIHFFADAVAKKNVLSVTLPKIVDVKTLIETQINCIAPETSAAVSTEPSSPPPSKNRKSLFDFLDGIPSEVQESKNELEDYPKYSKTAQEQPLAFWRLNGTRFPLLAKLAQRHPAMPATSGSVERLF
jgi:hypothetical protein